MRICTHLLCCLGLGSISSGAIASDNVTFSGIVALDSQRIYNGLSESVDNPSISLTLNAQATQNLSFGAVLSDAKFDDVRKRHRAISMFAVYDYQISDNYLISGTINGRKFLGNGRKWDYVEFQAQLAHSSGFSFSAVYSPDYYATDDASFGIAAHYQKRFDSGLYVKTELGYFDVTNVIDYKFVSATIGWSSRKINIDLGYHWVDENVAVSPIGKVSSPGFVVSFKYLAF